MRTLLPLLTGTVLSALIALPAFASGYRVEFDSLQTGVSELSGGTLVLQGGLTPIFTHGAATTYEEYPLVASGTCGNDVKEAGEACDGADFGSNTCASLGYESGTLSCTASCSVDTSACVAASSSSSTAQSGSTGGSGSSGGGTGLRPGAPSVSSSNSPAGDNGSQTEAPAPGPTSAPNSSSSLIASSDSSSSESTSASFSSLATTEGGDSGAPSSVLVSSTTPNLSGVDDASAQGGAPHGAATAPLSAAAMGSMTVTEFGILARLGWMSRMKGLYETIPAFLS